MGDGKDFKTVTAADNQASNGVVHIIDGVLLPPASLHDASPNIVELAQSVDDLSTLVAAVVAGDLAETLSSPGPFTVFAPTNEGFGKLPAGTVDTLLKPENKDQLVDILTYHVLAQEVPSKDLKFFQRVPTVEGKNLHIYKTHRGVFVTPDGKDFKTVTAADNQASNGVCTSLMVSCSLLLVCRMPLPTLSSWLSRWMTCPLWWRLLLLVTWQTP